LEQTFTEVKQKIVKNSIPIVLQKDNEDVSNLLWGSFLGQKSSYELISNERYKVRSYE
jgi:hypothetical protein